jgi:hypothetical protein
MSDMLDVLHVLFEEDQLVTEEVEKARSNLRAGIYTKLYGRETYEWGQEARQRQRYETDSTAGVVAPTTHMQAPRYTPQSEKAYDGNEVRHYGYIPPTQFDPTAAKPFGDVLDAPLG